ncbi:peptide-methionine (S)-S-oxide reductase MsrA [Halomonas sp. Bachu 37]|uniref:peptide-methionine (S)-S-oxide reductase MsrA n=1 Tax=Halomonas kashgarensis TaxID=3084920 RepID=UPI003216CA62
MGLPSCLLTPKSLRTLTLASGLVMSISLQADDRSGTAGAASNASESAPSGTEMATATFAGGCFWCMEPPFDRQLGVHVTLAGYIGGTLESPTYQQITAGDTGHAEAVEVRYNPDQIEYSQLLEVFWRNIDPFAEDQQFCDVGDQYRSAIFYHNEEQKRLAEASKERWEAHFDREIATEIVPATTFWQAEKYHQDYAERNPLRYQFYRYGCGRDKRLEAIWKDEAGGPTYTGKDE